VRAVDPKTVEVTTRQPYPILLNKLTFVLIVPAESPETAEPLDEPEVDDDPRESNVEEPTP